MEAMLKRFRDKAEGIGAGAGRKFPAHLKALGAEYARARRGEGTAWGAIASELGVIAATVQRWAKAEAGARGEFHEVRVERALRGSYSALLPGGPRIEGLELEAVVALARALA